MTARVGNGVLTPSAGKYVDTITWEVLSAADGSRCTMYVTFSKGGNNATYGGFIFHPGSPDNKQVDLVAPDEHAETASYALDCNLNGDRRSALSGTITIQ